MISSKINLSKQKNWRAGGNPGFFRNQLGFTLLEVMVVIVIISVISGVIFTNFRMPSKNATARKQTTSVILSDIRRAQSMTFSGSQFKGSVVCGYGVHYVSSTSYLMYAKLPPLVGGCRLVATRNYQALIDSLVQEISLINPYMKFMTQFSDVFFEAPDPKVYVNNVPLSLTPNNPDSTVISIGLQDQINCSTSPCDTLKIYNSGKIDNN